MAYEKSLISETQTAIPTQAPPQMREDREIDPYRHVRTPKIGQTTINSEPNVSGREESITPTTEETVTLSPQMAALARKEQKFRQRELELKKRAEQLEAEKLEIAELKALKAKLAAKDYSGVENIVKYDEYTQYLIEKDSQLSPELEAVKKLADEVEGLKTAQKEDVTKRFEAAVSERRKAVNSLIESNPEFSSIKELKMQEAVVQHILDTWEHDSVDLSPEDAAKEVENELIERANKWTTLSKLKAKSETPLVDEKKQLPPLKAGLKTLTNNMTATGEIKRPLKPLSQMTDSERYAEARRRAEEKLKQGIR